MISTGAAAVLLGTSRQHVVNLCSSGRLPFSLVGVHRRIRKADVIAFRDSGFELTREERRSLLLGYAVAGRLALNPHPGLQLAVRNLRTMRAKDRRGHAKVWLDQWQMLLDGPLLDLLAALTSPSPRSCELRQNSPFAGLLTDKERASILAQHRGRQRDLAS